MAAVSGCAGGGEPAADEGLPHLVLISVDTLRADVLDHVSRQPAEVGFAALRGSFVQCDGAVSTAAWTLPAHASMLTGLFPAEHGANFTDSFLAESARTVAERLQERGYETVAFSDGGLLDARFGFGRGFDLYNDAAGSASHRPLVSRLPRKGAPEPVPGTDPFDRARAFLSLRRSPSPLFLFLHTYGVHDYHQARPWVEGDPARRRLVSRSAACMTQTALCSEADWATLLRWYVAEVERMGVLVEQLLGHLAQELDDRPVAVLLTSDHGEGFAVAENRIHHGGRLEPEFVRVPLWVRPPAAGESKLRCDGRLVSLVDIAPTLVDLAGGDLAGFSGSPIGAIAPEQGRRAVFAEEHAFFWARGRRQEAREPAGELPKVAVIEPQLWAVLGGGEERVLRWRGEGVATSVDRGEAVAERIRRATRSYLEVAMASKSQRGPLPEDLRERLEALGYLTQP